jgi:putative signal transducing protein
VLTLGTYLNLIEAGLVKSFLEAHDIFCRLFDENAHLYGGAPFAMPVRLLVIDAQFERAARILADARRLVPEDENITAIPRDQETISEIDYETVEDQPQGFEERLGSNNPWEILAIAYLFFVPGLGFLLENRSLILTWRVHWRPAAFIVLSPLELHLAGALLIIAALFLMLLYFYMRRMIARDEQASRNMQPGN